MKINWDRTAKFTQVVAILASGLWALHEYLSFQRYSRRLTLTQQELARDLQKASIQYDIQKRRADAQVLELERQLKQSDVARVRRSPTQFDIRSTLSAADPVTPGQHKFAITIRVSNLSPNVVKFYEGQLNLYIGRISVDGLRAVKINSPNESGPINWKLVSRTTYQSREQSVNPVHPRSYADAQLDGLAIGTLEPQAHQNTSFDFRRRVKPTEWIAYQITYHIATSVDEQRWEYVFTGRRQANEIGEQTDVGDPVVNR